MQDCLAHGLPKSTCPFLLPQQPFTLVHTPRISRVRGRLIAIEALSLSESRLPVPVQYAPAAIVSLARKGQAEWPTCCSIHRSVEYGRRCAAAVVCGGLCLSRMACGVSRNKTKKKLNDKGSVSCWPSRVWIRHPFIVRAATFFFFFASTTRLSLCISCYVSAGSSSSPQHVRRSSRSDCCSPCPLHTSCNPYYMSATSTVSPLMIFVDPELQACRYIR